MTVERVDVGRGTSIRSLVALAALAAGVGAFLGAVWWWWAPRVVLQVSGDFAYPIDFQPGGFIADDGIAAVLCAVCGLALGVLTLAVQRVPSPEHSRATVSALVTAIAVSLLAALLLWFTGTSLGSVDITEQIIAVGDGGQFDSALRLRMTGVLLLAPLAAALVIAVVAVSDWIAGRWSPASSGAQP